MIGGDWYADARDFYNEQEANDVFALPLLWSDDPDADALGIVVLPPDGLPGLGALFAAIATLHKLMRAGYRLASGLLIRVRKGRTVYELDSVEIYRFFGGSWRHYYGFGLTVRDAYREACRIERLTTAWDSALYAHQDGGSGAVAFNGLLEDFEDGEGSPEWAQAERDAADFIYA